VFGSFIFPIILSLSKGRLSPNAFSFVFGFFVFPIILSLSKGRFSPNGWWRFTTPQTLSNDNGITTEPSKNFVGPAALGLMSKSKICVGNHSVAHALGTSTTPLMWPCTGAVPRME
jgi:hypothetical protein